MVFEDAHLVRLLTKSKLSLLGHHEIDVLLSCKLGVLHQLSLIIDPVLWREYELSWCLALCFYNRVIRF